MSDDATASRIRWDDKELQDIADEMARLLAAEPGLHLLTAVRRAQEKVIAKDRQRYIKAWSVAETKVGHLLVKAQAALQAAAGGTVGAAAEGTPAPESSGPGAQAASEERTADTSSGEAAEAVVSTAKGGQAPGQGVSALPAAEATGERQQQQPSAGINAEPGQLGALLAVSLESALLVALQSRSVEDALTVVFARAFKRAIDNHETGAAHQAEPGQRVEQRVLLAGFPIQMAKGIEDALRSRFDVRRWMPNQGTQMLETLTRMCSIAVIPEEADDEMGEAFRGRDLQVVRHDGSAARLVERLSTMAC